MSAASAVTRPAPGSGYGRREGTWEEGGGDYFIGSGRNHQERDGMYVACGAAADSWTDGAPPSDRVPLQRRKCKGVAQLQCTTTVMPLGTGPLDEARHGALTPSPSPVQFRHFPPTPSIALWLTRTDGPPGLPPSLTPPRPFLGRASPPREARTCICHPHPPAFARSSHAPGRMLASPWQRARQRVETVMLTPVPSGIWAHTGAGGPAPQRPQPEARRCRRREGQAAPVLRPAPAKRGGQPDRVG